MSVCHSACSQGEEVGGGAGGDVHTDRPEWGVEEGGDLRTSAHTAPHHSSGHSAQTGQSHPVRWRVLMYESTCCTPVLSGSTILICRLHLGAASCFNTRWICLLVLPKSSSMS